MAKDKTDINTKINKKDNKEIDVKAMRIGWVFVTVALVVIGVFRYIYGQPIMDLLMISTTYLTATSGYQYMHTKNKDDLFTVIVGTIALGLAFAALLSEYGIY